MKRVASIDLLRALAIIGMVISGQMLWNAELPRAMFHAQLPPPTFAFNPEVPGITWVDLVFPFFLFSMGCALPMALRRREAKGARWFQVTGSALHRFVWLAAFAILLGNTRMGRLAELAPWVAALVTLAIWLLFFAMFIRIPTMDRKHNTILNWGGFVALIAATLLYKPLFGVDVALSRSDIIILILASMALFGTLLWWVTRNSLTARILLIAAIALLKMASSIDGSWCQWLWQQTPAEWLFRFEFMKYLCIVLSGSVAGDMIYRHLTTDKEATAEVPSADKRRYIALIGLLVVLFALLMWGLFVRRVGLTVALAAVVGVIGVGIVRPMRGADGALYRALYYAMLAWMAIGLIAEPMEGGIKKDPATVGFFFVTSALAAMVLLTALICEQQFKLRLRPLEAMGANPMFAYTASGYLIAPLAALTTLSGAIEWFAGLTPWCGFLRGVLFALLVMAVTYPLTRKNYYWKS